MDRSLSPSPPLTEQSPLLFPYPPLLFAYTLPINSHHLYMLPNSLLYICGFFRPVVAYSLPLYAIIIRQTVCSVQGNCCNAASPIVFIRYRLEARFQGNPHADNDTVCIREHFICVGYSKVHVHARTVVLIHSIPMVGLVSQSGLLMKSNMSKKLCV